MSHPEKVLVVGLGNTLRGDDALGRIASQRLRMVVDSPHVRVIDQCAPTPELAAELADASIAVFLDASVDGPLDRIVTSRLVPRESVDALAHRSDPDALIGLALQLYGRAAEAFLVTFRGRSFDFSDCGLSPEAERGSDLLVEETLRLIQTHTDG